MKSNHLILTVFLFFIFIFLIPFVSSTSAITGNFVYDNPTIPHLNPTFNQSSVTVNNSIFWQGYTPTTLPHNILSGLQGGQSGQYYHLNQSLFDRLVSYAYLWITGDNVAYVNQSNNWTAPQYFLSNVTFNNSVIINGDLNVTGIITGTLNVTVSTANYSYFSGQANNSDYLNGYNATTLPHNNLAGLQGGNTTLNEFYHLDSYQYSTVLNQSSNFVPFEGATKDVNLTNVNLTAANLFVPIGGQMSWDANQTGNNITNGSLAYMFYNATSKRLEMWVNGRIQQDWGNSTTIYGTATFEADAYFQNLSGVGLLINTNVIVNGNVTSYEQGTFANVFAGNICYSDGTNCTYINGTIGNLTQAIFNMNSSLYNYTYLVNASLWNYTYNVNQSLYQQIIDLNVSQYNDTALILAVNGTLYNYTFDVNSSLYQQIINLNVSQYNDTLLILDVNGSLYNYTYNVNSSLYQQIINLNVSQYNDTILILQVNSSLYNYTYDVNSSLYNITQSINNSLINYYNKNENVTPPTNMTYALGNSTNWWSDIYVGAINAISMVVGTITTSVLNAGTVNATNVTADSIVASNISGVLHWSNLTEIPYYINTSQGPYLYDINQIVYFNESQLNATIQISVDYLNQSINLTNLRIDSLNQSLNITNYTLYNLIVNVNDSLYNYTYNVNSTLTSLINTVNSSLYNYTTLVNGSLYNYTFNVNQSLTNQINAINTNLSGNFYDKLHDVTPLTNMTYALGNSTNWWTNLWVGTINAITMFINTINANIINTNNLNATNATISEHLAVGLNSTNATAEIKGTTANLPITVCNNTVACYRFEEGSGTIAIDSSQYLNLAFIKSDTYAASKGSNGTGNYSIQSNSGYVVANDAPQLNVTDNFTVSAWINVTTNSDTNYIISKNNDNTLQNGYMFYVKNDKKLYFTVRRAGVTISNLRTTDNIILAQGGGWHHVAATMNGTTVIIYIDGVAKTTQPGGNAFAGASTDLFIGADSTTTKYFKGYIDEVGIYNSVLTGTQITNLFNNGFTLVNGTFLGFASSPFMITKNSAGDIVIVDQYGRMGINTANPTATLDVNGTLNVISAHVIKDLFIGGTIIGGSPVKISGGMLIFGGDVNASEVNGYFANMYDKNTTDTTFINVTMANDTYVPFDGATQNVNFSGINVTATQLIIPVGGDLHWGNDSENTNVSNYMTYNLSSQRLELWANGKLQQDWGNSTTIYGKATFEADAFFKNMSGEGLFINTNVFVDGKITAVTNITGQNIFAGNICYSDGANCTYLNTSIGNLTQILFNMNTTMYLMNSSLYNYTYEVNQSLTNLLNNETNSRIQNDSYLQSQINNITTNFSGNFYDKLHNVTPITNMTYTLGNSTNWWYDLWVGTINSASIIVGTINAASGTITNLNTTYFNSTNANIGNINAGNITANNISGAFYGNFSGNVYGNFSGNVSWGSLNGIPYLLNATQGPYLYDINQTVYFNETKLNATIQVSVDYLNQSINLTNLRIDSINQSLNITNYAIYEVNSSLYNLIIGVNGSLYNYTYDVNSSLYNFTYNVNQSLWNNFAYYYNKSEVYNKSESDARYVLNGTYTPTNMVNKTTGTYFIGQLLDYIIDTMQGSIDSLWTTKLNATDQRYNDTALILNVNGSLYNYTYEVNDSLYNQIVALNVSQYNDTILILDVNGSLYNYTYNVNSSLYNQILGLNVSQYNDTILIYEVNGSLYNYTFNVNQSLYNQILGLNVSQYNDTSLIYTVNETLFNYTFNVNQTLYNQIIALNVSQYNDTILILNVNQSLWDNFANYYNINETYNKSEIDNMNSSLYNYTYDVNQSLSGRIDNISTVNFYSRYENVTPPSNMTYTLGNSSNWWKELWVGTINAMNIFVGTINATSGTFQTLNVLGLLNVGSINATNITADNFYGNFSGNIDWSNITNVPYYLNATNGSYLYNSNGTIYLNDTLLNQTIADIANVNAYSQNVNVNVVGGSGVNISTPINYYLTQLIITAPINTTTFNFQATQNNATGNMIDKNRMTHTGSWNIQKGYSLSNDTVYLSITNSSSDGLFTIQIKYINNKIS